MSSPPSRSHARKGRPGSLDVDRTPMDASKGETPESFEEKLVRIQELKPSERREASRKASTHSSDRNPQHQAQADEEVCRRRAQMRRRDQSAPPSYDNAHPQRSNRGGSSAGLDDEPATAKDPASFSTRRGLLDPSSGLRTADSNTWPISVDQDSSPTRNQPPAKVASFPPNDEAPRAPFAPHSVTPSSAPAQTPTTSSAVTAIQYTAKDSLIVATHVEHLSIGPPGPYELPNAPSNCAGCLDTKHKVQSIYQEYQAIVDKQHQEIARLKNESESRLQENEDLAARVDDLQDMLASKVAPTGNPGASLIGDAEVQARWNGLCFSIRQVVTDHINPPENIPLGRLRGNIISLVRPLTPIHELLLKDKDGCNMLAQAVIWSVLAKHVFGNGNRMSCMYWGGKFSEALCCLTDDILQSGSVQRGKPFHSWRRQTATLVDTLACPEDVGTYVDDLLNNIEGKLKHLLSDWPGNLRKRIHEIVLSAIRLDCELSQQCAYWYVCYPNTDQVNRARAEFDKTSMKVPAAYAANQRVALMISPALYKAGDSRGERYDQIEIACKSEVICLASARPSPPTKDFVQGSGVPQVVDSKTERLRQQQYASSSKSKENETTRFQKIFGWISTNTSGQTTYYG